MGERERVKRVIYWLISQGVAGNQEEVAQHMGYNASSLSQIVTGKKPVSEKFVRNLCALSDKLNVDYLLMTSDDMLLDDGVRPSSAIRPDAQHMEAANVKNIPMVSQYAYAGYLSGYSDKEYLESLPTVPFIVSHEAKGSYVCFEVKGDSMDDGTQDSILDGDRLLCREVAQHLWATNKLHIRKWDFVIVHRTDGILVKRIAAHDIERGVITIHSLNPEYPDRPISLADIVQIFNVVEVSRSRKR